MSIYKKKQLFWGVVLFVSDSQKCTKRVFFPKEFLRGTTTVKYLEPFGKTREKRKRKKGCEKI